MTNLKRLEIHRDIHFDMAKDMLILYFNFTRV